MKFPSLQLIFDKTTRTLKRFPLVLLSAAIAVGCAVYLSGNFETQDPFFFNIILTAILGIPLFTVLQLTAEQQQWSSISKMLVTGIAVLLLVGYFFTFPADLDTASYKYVYRYILYILGVHLLVAVGPYVGSHQLNEFWQYNKTLFLRFLTAVFFSGVLYIGLTVALGSVEYLLEIDVASVRYFQLFIILAGIFNTWFFLAGIPANLTVFESSDQYPKGLKVFTQNILLPLVTIYLAILYLYTGKILLQWSWPEGWITYLVLSFSITGILALLLLHPIRDMDENRWIKTFSNSFFWALVPLVILLLLAISRRIWEYSFTIERYFVLTLGLWLTGIVIYFIFSKKENIKVIPASLCILTFLISFGPWGAFSVSERSQVNRLEYYLKENDLLLDEKIQKSSGEVSFEDRQQISSIVSYLNENHGLDGIQPWFDQDLDSLMTKTAAADSAQPVPHYNRPEHVVALLDIEYEGRSANQPAGQEFKQFQTDRKNMLKVDGVGVVIQNINWPISGNSNQEHSLSDGRTLIMRSDTADITLYLDSERQDSITIRLKQLIQQLADEFSDDQRILPDEAMTLDRSTGSLAIRIYFNQISWRTKDGQIIPQNARFDIGIK